ncbi:GNAT family N-acetyltransferase [Crenobacter sp. SG2305]|uniref:GNAT family N-acetyltransferase n=1 Tax=Crenobacter oryzisoli TaxID=3056844 RepID=UPI0025AAF567|nr:GNAT family N-acetyltransferase [Crenobacter sp. SG2305]MDN0081477.1 GNAT family N-acetyltransferase [Crenobacter sp. SG2305]
MHIDIRRLIPSEAVAYRQLMLEAYQSHPEAFTSSVEERAALPLSWWGERLTEASLAPEVVFAAFDGGRLAGVAGIAFESREKVRHKANLFGMYVPVRYRGQGLGQRLIQTVLNYAKLRGGVRIVQLTVTDDNDAACRLYARCGFLSYGLEPLAVRVGDTFMAKRHMYYDLNIRPAAPHP